jgi:hypothetical protein
LILPDDWWTIPLTDDDARRRAVSAVVNHRFGHGDANAGLKRQVRGELLSSADRAARAGGWVMAMMLAQAGPMPLPATLTAYRLPGSFADTEGLRKVQEPLTASVQVGGRLDAGQGPFGMVLRAVRERSGPVERGGPGVSVLVCEYWSDPADGQGLANLVFSTPLVALRDGFLDLFDAIAGTLHLLDDNTADDDPSDDPSEGISPDPTRTTETP